MLNLDARVGAKRPPLSPSFSSSSSSRIRPLTPHDVPMALHSSLVRASQIQAGSGFGFRPLVGPVPGVRDLDLTADEEMWGRNTDGKHSDVG